MVRCHVGQVLKRLIFSGTEYERGLKRWVEVKGSQQKGDEATLYSFPVLTSILERMRCCGYFPLSPTFTSCRRPQHLNYDVKNENIDLKDVKTV